MKVLSIIIPVFNEVKTVKEILQKIEAVKLDGWQKEVIIVDDGSNDGTAAILKNLEKQYSVLCHDKNRGKGAAIKTALKNIRGDYAIIQDADLEYDPKDWLLLLKKATDNPELPAIYGSRNLNKTSRGYFAYYLGGRFLTALINLIFGTKLTDINTGYKLFRTDVLKSLNLKSNGFEFCEEATIKLLKGKYAIREVPISYQPRNFEEGKKISSKDGIIGIWAIIKYSFFD